MRFFLILIFLSCMTECFGQLYSSEWSLELGAIGAGKPIDGVYASVEKNMNLNSYFLLSPAFTFSSIQSHSDVRLNINPDFPTPFTSFFQNNMVSSNDSVVKLRSWTAGSLDLYASIDLYKLGTTEGNKNSLLIGSGYGMKIFSENITQLSSSGNEYLIDYLTYQSGINFSLNLVKVSYLRQVSDRVKLGVTFTAYNGADPFSLIGFKVNFISPRSKN